MPEQTKIEPLSATEFVRHRTGRRKNMQEKDIFIEEELTEEMLKELSNGKGDDDDE